MIPRSWRSQIADEVRATSMMKPKDPYPPEAVAEIERLRDLVHKLDSERRMIVSHATMGATDGSGLSVNDVSCEITKLRNAIYDEHTSRVDNLKEELAKEMALSDRLCDKHHEIAGMDLTGASAVAYDAIQYYKQARKV